jgi:uncharacterized membrane protein
VRRADGAGPPGARYAREVAAARRAADRLELISRLAVVAGVAVAAGVAALLAAGGLELTSGLDWLGVVVFSTVLAGLGGYVSAWGLRLNASRLEMSLSEAAAAAARDADDRAEEGTPAR